MAENDKRPKWVKVWISNLSELTDQFRNEDGAVDFESLGREEYLYRMALSTKNFKNSARAKLAWDAAVRDHDVRSENGKKGGRPKKEKEPQKEKEQNKEKDKQTEPKKPAAVKHAIDGDRGFVTVTDDEEAYLVTKYGKDLDEMVSILSNYKESTGKKYKSDAAALRGWVHDSLLEKRAKAERNQPQKSFAQQERERMAASARSLLTDDQIKFYGL
jgi:hypothetical protein